MQVLIRRAQVPDLLLGNYKVNTGLDILISVYNIHHSSKVLPNSIYMHGSMLFYSKLIRFMSPSLLTNNLSCWNWTTIHLDKDDWLPFSFFNNTCELIHCLVHADCISNNIFLVDMGMNSWLNFFYWISCMVFYVLYFMVWFVEWQISIFAVFVWIEKLAFFYLSIFNPNTVRKMERKWWDYLFFLNFFNQIDNF